MIKRKAVALLASALIAASLLPAAVYASGMDPAESENGGGEYGTWHDFQEDEGTDGLTPEGNLTLVDDYGDAPEGGQQFVTLVTKKGNYFYLIIDRDSEGENTVHFLNMVDERDLFDLLDEDEQSAYLAQIEALKAEKEAAEKAAEEAVKPEGPEETKPEKKKVNLLPIFLIVILIAAGGGGWFLLQLKKKKKEDQKPDPDAFYEEEEDTRSEEDLLSQLDDLFKEDIPETAPDGEDDEDQEEES